jgi:hypothetical protein
VKILRPEGREEGDWLVEVGEKEVRNSNIGASIEYVVRDLKRAP